MPVHRIASAALSCALLAGCGTARTVEPVETPARPVEPVETPRANLPASWRWESFGGVQVGVPGDWGWGNAVQRTGQWCISTPRERAEPIVGRPAGMTLVGCPAPEPGEPDPGTLLENTGTLVDLAWVLDERPGTTHEGNSTTVVLGGVAVTVVASTHLREQIAATVHEVADRRDVYGCPVTDPVWTDPGRRPDPPVDVTTLDGVSEVSVCRYAVTDPAARVPGGREPLVSSRRLTGAAAQEAVDAIAAAPPGGGPDNPGDCLPDYSYGDGRSAGSRGRRCSRSSRARTGCSASPAARRSGRSSSPEPIAAVRGGGRRSRGCWLRLPRAPSRSGGLRAPRS